jgi:hypothetical protein
MMIEFASKLNLKIERGIDLSKDCGVGETPLISKYFISGEWNLGR